MLIQNSAQASTLEILELNPGKRALPAGGSVQQPIKLYAPTEGTVVGPVAVVEEVELLVLEEVKLIVLEEEGLLALVLEEVGEGVDIGGKKVVVGSTITVVICVKML